MQRDGKRNIVDITATSVQNSVGFLQWWPYIDLREVQRYQRQIGTEGLPLPLEKQFDQASSS